MSAGTQRPTPMDDAHDDDDESWNSGSNLSDGEGEMAFLAANFGGILAEMVQHWRLQTAV
jgi:hypothetical protein